MYTDTIPKRGAKEASHTWSAASSMTFLDQKYTRGYDKRIARRDLLG